MAEIDDAELDSFLDSLGKKPNMQVDFQAVAIPERVSGVESTIVQETVNKVKENLQIDVFPDVPKTPVGLGTPSCSEQQKRNIGVIAYSLYVQDITVSAEEIYNAWPVKAGGDFYKLQRAGARPSISAIHVYIGTETFKEDMALRGVEFSREPGGLTDEQIALLHILTDTTNKAGINARLRKAGVTAAKFRSWKRQPAFAEAYGKLVDIEKQDITTAIDTQLMSMASNGDLNAIKYLNDLIGRGPNDKKAVDAMAFSKIVLEAVMRHVKNPDILKAISAEIEMASKQIGP